MADYGEVQSNDSLQGSGGVEDHTQLASNDEPWRYVDKELPSWKARIPIDPVKTPPDPPVKRIIVPLRPR